MVGDAPKGMGSQHGGHLGIAEHGGAIAEGEVGGDDDRGLLVEHADQMEQELSAGSGERQVAQFIEDHQIEPAKLGGDGTGLPDAGFWLESGNEIDRVEVTPADTGTHDAGGDRDGQMRLARPCAADEHDVAATG